MSRLHWMFCLFFGGMVTRWFGLVSFWGEGTSPTMILCQQKNSVSVWSCGSAWLHVASEPVMEYVKCTWMISEVGYLLQNWLQPSGPRRHRILLCHTKLYLFKILGPIPLSDGWSTWTETAVSYPDVFNHHTYVYIFLHVSRAKASTPFF